MDFKFNRQNGISSSKQDFQGHLSTSSMGSRAFCRASRTWDFDPPSNEGGFQGWISGEPSHDFAMEKWWIS